MIEHRAIEKALKLLAVEKARIENGAIDVDTVRMLVELIFVVGDELHHGKEETIMFPALRGKKRSYEFDDVTSTLMKEHASIRHHLRTIRNAMEWYSKGDKEAAETITRGFGEICDLYSRHSWNSAQSPLGRTVKSWRKGCSTMSSA